MIGEDVRGAGGVATLARVPVWGARAHRRRARLGPRLPRWLTLGVRHESTPPHPRSATNDANGTRAPRSHANGGTSSADGAMRAEFERFFAASESQVSSYLYRVTGDAHLASVATLPALGEPVAYTVDAQGHPTVFASYMPDPNSPRAELIWHTLP